MNKTQMKELKFPFNRTEYTQLISRIKLNQCTQCSQLRSVKTEKRQTEHKQTIVFPVGSAQIFSRQRVSESMKRMETIETFISILFLFWRSFRSFPTFIRAIGFNRCLVFLIEECSVSCIMSPIRIILDKYFIQKLYIHLCAMSSPRLRESQTRHSRKLRRTNRLDNQQFPVNLFLQ